MAVATSDLAIARMQRGSCADAIEYMSRDSAAEVMFSASRRLASSNSPISLSTVTRKPPAITVVMAAMPMRSKRRLPDSRLQVCRSAAAEPG